MSTYYTNADGLTQRFGTIDSENKGRKTNTRGELQELVLDIVGSELADAASNEHLVGAASLPAGAHITKATLWVTAAFVGATAVLDIGVYKSLDLSTIDDDGIDAAIAVAALVDNAEIACDGAIVDTTLANDSYIAASYDTAAFTAGVAKLVVEYMIT